MKMSLSIRCLALVLILSLGVVTGCIRSPDKEYGGKGEVLSVGAYKPRLLDRVVYTVQDQNWVITSQEEGFKIAAVRARAVNLTSTQVNLSVDEDAATLNAEDGDEFKLFEPGTRAVETTEEAPEDNPYGAHLWGQFQLFRGFEIAGWLFFEVPKDSEFSDIIWDDVEFVRVPYPE